MARTCWPRSRCRSRDRNIEIMLGESVRLGPEMKSRQSDSQIRKADNQTLRQSDPKSIQSDTQTVRPEKADNQTVRQSDPKSRQSDTQTVRPGRQTVRQSDSHTRHADGQTLRHSDLAGRQSDCLTHILRETPGKGLRTTEVLNERSSSASFELLCRVEGQGNPEA